MTLHDTGPLRSAETAPSVPAEASAASAAPAVPLRPPTAGGISMRPAMVVLGLAALILAAFVALGIATSHPATPVHGGAGPSVVAGTALRAEPAAAVLEPIVHGGQPPTNVVNALFVPEGAVRVAHADNTASSGQYDAQVVLRSSDSQAALLAFFAADLKAQGWQVLANGSTVPNHPGSLEVLGKLAGSDGYYWEVGATVAPTTFVPGGPARGTTDVTLRLVQLPDTQ
jgi:hypothetical protein